MTSISKYTFAVLSACVMGLGFTACGNRETPAKTEADVSQAQAVGAKEVAKESLKAEEKTTEAHRDVLDANAEMAHESAVGNRAVDLAKAEAAHKVSIERCEGLTGDARTGCKKQADADLYQAKLEAESRARANDPKR